MEQSYVIRNDRVIGKTVPNINYNYSTCPIGSIFAFSSERIPLGFFICDGASYKVAEYPDLYAVIGNTYGGDTENFNVPDYRETVLVGVGENTTDIIADHDVYELGEFKDDQLQGHEHSTYKNYEGGATGGAGSATNYGGVVHTLDIASDGTNGEPRKGTTTHGKQKGVTYIIKAFHTNEGMDEGVSDDVVDYVDNKLSSVDIKTTVTIPAGQYLKVELGENKLSTVLLSMKTTIGTGYTTFLISNYGIGTDARCKVQQLQGEKKFAKYIDGCNLYITPSMTDQVWYASAISVQGVNPVLSASETYSGTEITTNSVPKEIVDGLIKDTSSTTSTYSSAKIDEKYGAYIFGTADATQWLKLTLGNSSKFQPITITDQYGGKVEITGMADDGTYKSVKLVRYSYGDWNTYSATDYTLYDGVDPNYKIQRLFYYPTNGCYYLEIRQWCTIKVSGAISKPEMVTSLPTETSAMTSIPESRFATKKDIDGTTIQTTTTTGSEYYAITFKDKQYERGNNQGILIQHNRLNFEPVTFIFSASSYNTASYERDNYDVTKINGATYNSTSPYMMHFYMDKTNNTLYLSVPSYSGVTLMDLQFKSDTIIYTKVDAIPDTATKITVTEYVTKNGIPTTRSLTLKSGYNGYITETYDPTTKVVVYNVNVSGTFKGLGNSIATGFKVPKDVVSDADVMHTTLGLYGTINVSTGDAQFTRLLIRSYSNPFLDVDIQGDYIINGTITYATA